jgi:hypothetical protein
LVNSTAPLSGTCPSGPSISDLVGYGSTANCFEGSGPASAPSARTADFRKGGGCVKTSDNAEDFFVAVPFPRNTTSPFNNCTPGAAPNLTINNASIAEGNAGPATATFTVSLSTPAPSTDVTFDIATADGTAQDDNPAASEDNDYVAKTLTGQVIPAGQQTYVFTIAINGDTVIEPDETFFVNVTNVSGATVTDGQGEGTIQKDDNPTLSINDVALTEGDSGTKVFSFTVSLSANAPAPVTFDIATADGTAQDDNPAVSEDNDYVARRESGLLIPTGQSTFSFEVTVNGDTTIEANETLFVNVTNVSEAIVGDSQGLGTIQNDDSPSLAIDDVIANEGDSGITIFTFTVTSSLPAPAGGITFDIATADGTAQDGNPATEDNDYVAQSLTGQTIAAGMSTYTFDVTVSGDIKNEAACETFFVNISNATNATILDGQGQGGITDEDGTKLVISQIYGGGGNAGATYTNDFIEIFNRGNRSVSLNGISVQYSAATSTSGNYSVTVLPNVALQPGQYFLIQEAGGSTGVPLPIPDATGSIAMAAGTGKVALVNSTVPLSASGCPSGAAIIDFVGYGSTANCREGATSADNAPGPSNNTMSTQRKLSGCQDVNNNQQDFATAPVAPRNTATTLSHCRCIVSYSSIFLPFGFEPAEALAFLHRR